MRFTFESGNLQPALILSKSSPNAVPSVVLPTSDWHEVEALLNRLGIKPIFAAVCATATTILVATDEDAYSIAKSSSLYML